MRAVLSALGPYLVCVLMAQNSPHTVRGGTLRVALRAEPKTFNPVIALDAPSREVIRRMHADLISIDRATQQTVPSLAESWSVNGTRYVLKLRRGVRFSDGVPFTADDVIFSFRVYMDESVHSPQRDLLMIEDRPIRVNKLDEYTVEFLLPRPYAAAERLFDSVAILPKHKLEKAWKAGTLAGAWPVNGAIEEFAGLGPFRLKEYKPGEAIVVERNPYYWKGYWKASMPNLDGIEFRLLADEDLQLARFVSGQLDVLNRLAPKSATFLQARNKETVTDLGPGLEYNFLCFNLSPGSAGISWFGRREFREALSLAADRESIARLVFQGRATPIWGHVPPGNRWWAGGLPHPPRSLAVAKQKLRESGFRWDAGQRLLDSSGKVVEFSILVSSSSKERQQMAAILQDDFKNLGIAVVIAPLEFRAVLDRVLKTRDFETVLLGLGGGDADPNPEMGVWLSSGAMHLWNPSQKQPATEWEAEIDRLMKRQMVTLNPSERRKVYDQVQGIVAREQPMIFLASPHIVVAQNGRVGNFRPAILDHHTLWNADELFLRAEGFTH